MPHMMAKMRKVNRVILLNLADAECICELIYVDNIRYISNLISIFNQDMCIKTIVGHFQQIIYYFVIASMRIVVQRVF